METKVYFDYSFCIEKGNKRKIQFSVSYVHRAGNKEPYFATDSSLMNHTRTDINRGGQCQKDVLPNGSLAYKFYEKWDKKHLQTLNNQEMTEVLADIEELKKKYDYVSIVDGKQEVTFTMEVDLQRKNANSLDMDKRIMKTFDYKIHTAK